MNMNLVKLLGDGEGWAWLFFFFNQENYSEQLEGLGGLKPIISTGFFLL